MRRLGCHTQSSCRSHHLPQGIICLIGSLFASAIIVCCLHRHQTILLASHPLKLNSVNLTFFSVQLPLSSDYTQDCAHSSICIFPFRYNQFLADAFAQYGRAARRGDLTNWLFKKNCFSRLNMTQILLRSLFSSFISWVWLWSGILHVWSDTPNTIPIDNRLQHKPDVSWLRERGPYYYQERTPTLMVIFHFGIIVNCFYIISVLHFKFRFILLLVFAYSACSGTCYMHCTPRFIAIDYRRCLWQSLQARNQSQQTIRAIRKSLVILFLQVAIPDYLLGLRNI